jgi:IS5 family transposase
MVWYFRERLAKTGKDKAIWNELQRHLDAKGLEIRKGTIQDATFITADPGHAATDIPRDDNAKTRISNDGTLTKKGMKSYFGYKLHTKEDCDFGLIRALDVTTASTHDWQIDLSKEGEVVYRDRGSFGPETNGFNATMKRGVRSHPIGIRDILRNARISRIRSPGEASMPSSRMCSIPLILASLPLSGFMQKWYSLRSASTCTNWPLSKNKGFSSACSR